MKRLKLTILFIFTFTYGVRCQSLHQDISDGFQLGKSELISAHLAEELELITPESEGTFSKDMTARKLTAFFNSSKPNKFEMVHQGKSPSGSTYYIAELITEKGTFRVYILFSGQKVKNISELRIESDE